MIKNNIMRYLLFIIFISACNSSGPEPVAINKDMCSYCHMTISDLQFCAELITSKKKIYKYDDIGCLLNYLRSNSSLTDANYWVANSNLSEELLPAENAYYVKSETIHTPMNGNIAAFSNAAEASLCAKEKKGIVLSWNEIKK